MLKNLTIKNIALIDNLEITFADSFCVLSGETGAGKSIIIDSLAFVLGERADKSLIKSGEDHAFVEAVFEIQQNLETYTALTEYGYEADTTVVLSRSMTLSGKNECRINGRICAVSVLKNVSATLADIFGQSEHINVLKPDTHIKILDKFEPTEDIEKLNSIVHEYRAQKSKLSQYGGSEAERNRTLDLLNYEIKDIESADLSQQEEDDLKEQKSKVINIEKIATALKNSLTHLTESSNISSEIWLAGSSLNGIEAFDKDYAQLNTRLTAIKYEIDDITSTLQQKVTECDYNPIDIDKTEERLDQYKRLKKKYGQTVADVLNYLTEAKQKYNNLIDATAQIQQITAELTKLKTKAYELCKKISIHRKQSASKFCALVTTELIDLGIKNAIFTLSFGQPPEFDDYTPTPNGFDTAEFMFSANKGEPIKPLSKVISGGEMSRFLLAIKNITANIENIPTMVFDEIDVGLSGQIAQMVAKKLANISKNYQCIVVTHLPQVAAMGDANYLISKSVVQEKTRTDLLIADTDTKTKEIARLMGGENIGEYSILHAKEMIEWALSYKKSL